MPPRLLLNASSPQLFPEALLDWANLSSSLSDENLLFDLYVHITVIAKKKPKKNKKHPTSVWPLALPGFPKLEGWRWQRVQWTSPTLSKYQQEVTTQTDRGHVSSLLFPQNFAQTPSNRWFRAEVKCTRSSEEKENKYCPDLHLFAEFQGWGRAFLFPHAVPLQFGCNTDFIQDVLDYINPSHDPQNLVVSPLRLNAPVSATLHLPAAPIHPSDAQMGFQR